MYRNVAFISLCCIKYNIIHFIIPFNFQSTEPLVCDQIPDGFVCRCNPGFNLNETTRSTCDGNKVYHFELVIYADNTV